MGEDCQSTSEQTVVNRADPCHNTDDSDGKATTSDSRVSPQVIDDNLNDLHNDPE